MPKDGKKLPPIEIAKMREAYIKTNSMAEASKITGYHPDTISKYRKIENWDELAKRRELKVAEKAEEKDIKRRIDDLEVVNNAIDLLSDDIDKKRPNIRRKLADLHSLITAKQLLTGKATGRQEHTGNLKIVIADGCDRDEA